MDMDIEREEGEMSDNEMYIEQEAMENQDKSTILFKKDNNGLIVEQLEKIDAFKFEERAKRFGVSLTGNKIITQKQIDELYYNFGIKDGNARHFRFDTLYLSGVDGLTTKEIFEYLKDYKPVAIEWIDDNSCNIVCQDHISVALALLIHSHEITDDSVKERFRKNSPYHLREGIPHPKKDLILMRFATNSDKKITKKKLYDKPMEEIDNDGNLSTNNPWGDLCRSWGVYDHQELFRRKLPQDSDENDELETNSRIQVKNKGLAMRLGKRQHKHEEGEDSSDSEWRKKSKTPRMRMRADDEEYKLKKPQVESSDEDANVYAPLSIEVINTKSTNYMPRTFIKLSEKFKNNTKDTVSIGRKSVQSRLGAKVSQAHQNSSSDESASDSEYNTMSRVQRVNTSSSKSPNSVWSRLELKSNNSSDKPNDLREKLKMRQKKTDDLRDVLSKTKQSNLRIEVDNNYVNK